MTQIDKSPAFDPLSHARLRETTPPTSQILASGNPAADEIERLFRQGTPDQHRTFAKNLITNQNWMSYSFPSDLLAAANRGLQKDIGFALRNAYYSGDFTAEQIADFAGFFSGQDPASVRGIFELIDNAGVTVAVGQVLAQRFAKVDPGQSDAGNLAALMLDVADIAKQQGDARPAIDLFEAMWVQPDLRFKLAASVVDARHTGGMEQLGWLMVGLDRAGLVAKDKTEAVFQDLLVAGADSALVRGRPRAINPLVVYFGGNAERLVEESILPRTRSNAPIAARNEADDARIVELVVSNMLLNPGLPYSQMSAMTQRINTILGDALDIANDTSAPLKARTAAAQKLGFLIGAIEQGYVRSMIALDTRKEVFSVGSQIAAGAALDFLPKPGGPLGVVIGQAKRAAAKQIAEHGKEFVAGRLSDDGIAIPRAYRRLTEQVNLNAEALLPDGTGPNPEPLAWEIARSFESGRSSADIYSDRVHER